VVGDELDTVEGVDGSAGSEEEEDGNRWTGGVLSELGEEGSSS